MMRCAGDAPYGLRTRALVVLLWRAGLRISEAIALAESGPGPGDRRRFAPHQLRHAHAVDMARIDNSEIINGVYARPAPMLPASAGLR